MPFAAAQMDLEIIILSKQTEEIQFICGIKKMTQINIQNRNRFRLQKQIQGYQRVNGSRRDKLGIWD